MSKFLKFILDEVFYNGHFQTWGSLAIVIFSSQLLHVNITWDLLLIVYLLFYLIYLKDRYYDIDIDSLTNQHRSRHIRNIYKYIPYVIFCGVTTLTALLYFFSNFSAFIFIIAVGVFGFLYGSHLKKATAIIPCFKNICVALVFAVLVFLPAIYYGVFATTWLVILSATVIFVRGLMMQFFLDLKDIEGDKKNKLKTLPVLWGREKVYNLINVLNFSTALFFPVLYFAAPGLGVGAPMFFLAGLALVDSYYLNMIRKGNLFGYVLVGGEFISWPILVYLGKFIIF